MQRCLRVLCFSLSLFLVACAGIPPIKTNNQSAKRIARAMPQYAQLAKHAWRPIRAKTPMRFATKGLAVVQVRKRLALLGDLPDGVSQDSTFYDNPLAAAVKHFQWRHGLRMSGQVDQKTLAALNVTPKQRLKQLHASMKRFAKLPDGEGSHHIHVNIPSYQLDVVKDGDRVLNMKIVAGKPRRPTPTLYSKVQTIVFNPKWNVPRTIANKDIVPKVLKNPNYLAENDIQIFSNWTKNRKIIDPNTIDWTRAKTKGFPYKFTQMPGDNNALGRVKFIFMNKHDVYMHDTPEKGLFNAIRRAYSSGCIRLEKPYHLVEYFIQQNDNLDYDKVDQYIGAGKIKYVRLKNPLPIYVTYITAWVDKAGKMHFREDVYQRDTKPGGSTYDRMQ